jgi:hypothetical protein
MAALMAMVREQDAFFVSGPVLDFARTWMQRWRATSSRTDGRSLPAMSEGPMEAPPGRMLANAAVGIAAGLLAYVPQALAYLALNGYVGPSRLVARKMTWTSPHVLEVLLSPSHGFLVWTPLAALAVAGLGRQALGGRSPRRREAQWVASCLLVMLALQVYVAGSVESWTVAGAFGQRRFVAVTCLLVVGLAALWSSIRTPLARQVGVALALLCVWWNLGLILQFGAGLMDRQRLEPARNAYVSFVVLPRLVPYYVHRYVFARESFYRQDDP